VVKKGLLNNQQYIKKYHAVILQNPFFCPPLEAPGGMLSKLKFLIAVFHRIIKKYHAVILQNPIFCLSITAGEWNSPPAV
jgi:hypothetical protein